MLRLLGVGLALFPLGSVPSSLDAKQGQSALCDEAAYHASQRTGVPADVLRALTRTETGRSNKGEFNPWPWTVNMEGKGQWFSTRDEASAFAFLGFKDGARSFDVGCFQINYKWHGQAFASLEDMFDPQHNALYAAQFLKKLFEEFGNWNDAAAAYHSRTPEYAEKYKSRFERILTQLNLSISSDLLIAAVAPRANNSAPGNVNDYPLLQQRHVSKVNMGSLVPLSQPGSKSLWFQVGG